MRLLLDVDGVLCDLVGQLCRLLPHRHVSDFTAYQFEHVLTLDELETVRRAMTASGFCRDLPWHDGALDFVQRLRLIGEVVAVTRPYDESPTWTYERARWLRPHVPDVVHTDRKTLIPGDVLIEDSLENAVQWSCCHAAGLAIIIDRPWNQEPPRSGYGATIPTHRNHGHGVLRVMTYEHALDAIKAKARGDRP
jgi:5'(3')-deoxyribonucleotidase